jgi:hypothetical protein
MAKDDTEHTPLPIPDRDVERGDRGDRGQKGNLGDVQEGYQTPQDHDEHWGGPNRDKHE